MSRKATLSLAHDEIVISGPERRAGEAL